MKSNVCKNIGIGLVIFGIFIGLAPIPFLSRIKAGESAISDMPLQVIRFGQDLATARFKDVSSLPRKPNTKLIEVDGLEFTIEFDRSLAVSFNEIEAIVDAAAKPIVANQFSFARRILFDGWEPSFLPLRITYRYILVVAFGLILIGLFFLKYNRIQVVLALRRVDTVS